MVGHVIPIVAVQIDAPTLAPALEQTLLDACTTSLTHLECAPAREVKGEQAAAIAIITTPEADVVVVELADSARNEWLTRRLQFQPDEPAAERWKSVGFSIGSLLGSSDRSYEASPAPSSDPPTDTPSQSTETPSSPPVGLGLGSVTNVGLGDSPWTTGAELSLWGGFWGVAAPHVSVAYLVSPDLPEQIQLRIVDLAAGLSFRWAASESWSARLRAQATFQNLRVSATSPEATPPTRELTAWVPGARVGLDGMWTVAEHWAGVLRIDGFFQDGSTAINYETRRVATVSGRGLLVGLTLEYSP